MSSPSLASQVRDGTPCDEEGCTGLGGARARCVGDTATSRQAGRQAQREEGRRGSKKSTTHAVPEWSPTSVLDAPDEV